MLDAAIPRGIKPRGPGSSPGIGTWPGGVMPEAVEQDKLPPDAFEANQVGTQRERVEETVKHRIPGTDRWLLVPGRSSDPTVLVDAPRPSPSSPTPALPYQGGGVRRAL